jgi:LPXTG-motif cell wall-anchored protein
MSTSNSSPISSANAEPKPSSSGLSTGVKAGIGAAVGGVLLIAVVVLGLYFRKKRKQDSQYAQPQELAYEPPAPKYEMYHDSAMKYEMPSSPVVEVPNHEGPAELPGHMPESTRQLP